MTNLNNTEHMRQLIQLVESHILDRLAETWPQDQLAKIKQQIIDYRKEGWTDREISERMGKEPKWVATMVYNHFPDLRKQTKLALAAKDDDKEKISQEFQQGNITIKQLAKKNGIDGKTVKHWLEDKLGKEEVARLQALYTKPDRNWTQNEKSWAVDQYRQGTGPAAIAAIFMTNIDREPPGTEEMTGKHVSDMLKSLPNYRELQSQFQANRHLRRKPEPFHTWIYRAGRIDPEGRKTDWGVRKG